MPLNRWESSRASVRKMLISVIVPPARPRSHRCDPPAFCRHHPNSRGVATVRMPAYVVDDVLHHLKLNSRELENVVHPNIRMQLVGLKQADLLAAAEASRLAAAAGRPKNRLRLAHFAHALVELSAARLTRTTVGRAEPGSKTHAPVTTGGRCP